MFEDLFDNSDAPSSTTIFPPSSAVQETQANRVVNLRSYIAGSDERQGKLGGVVTRNNANALPCGCSVFHLRKISLSQSTNIVDVAEAMLEGNERIRGSEYLTSGGRYIPVCLFAAHS